MINWEVIVEDHGPDVWRTAYRLLSSREDANDCYQETFLQAVRYSQQHSVKNWSAVLRRIATARALDQLRKRYRHVEDSLEQETADPTHTGVEGNLNQEELMEQIRLALTQLPQNQATAFWLCEVEVLSHGEVAEQMDSQPRQVAVWLHRAKKQLRKMLANWKVEK